MVQFNKEDNPPSKTRRPKLLKGCGACGPEGTLAASKILTPPKEDRRTSQESVSDWGGTLEVRVESKGEGCGSKFPTKNPKPETPNPIP